MREKCSKYALNYDLHGIVNDKFLKFYIAAIFKTQMHAKNSLKNKSKFKRVQGK